MSRQIKKLAQLTDKPSRMAIGLMSGTSLDGLDIACCRISGHGSHTEVALHHFQTYRYSPSTVAAIRAVFAKKRIDFIQLSELNVSLAQTHADMVLKALKKWKVKPTRIDFIASHGQTVFHAPKGQHGASVNSTLQIGDGDHLARHTGITTVSDFRQKHVAAGGEGAPLAGYGDYLLFSKTGKKRVMLNIGGISNFTWLPGTRKGVLVTDTGPGNTLIDLIARRYWQKPFDKNGHFARAGSIHEGLLRCLKEDPFFSAPFPKTTGPEYFNDAFIQKARKLSGANRLKPADLMATCTQLTVETIVEAIQKLGTKNLTIYGSGGGMHNPVIREGIAHMLPTATLESSDVLGIPADAKEAILFAVLANETLTGTGTALHALPATTFGKISLPG